MKNELNYFCPLTGKRCRLDCAWLVDMTLTNNITGETRQERRCAIFWLVTLKVENNRLMLNEVQAVEGLRNETQKNQQYLDIIGQGFVNFLKLMIHRKQLEEKRDVKDEK